MANALLTVDECSYAIFAVFDFRRGKHLNFDGSAGQSLFGPVPGGCLVCPLHIVIAGAATGGKKHHDRHNSSMGKSFHFFSAQTIL